MSNVFDNGYEHRIGAKLHDYEYNNTIDKEDLVPNIRRCIDSLYTASLNKQRFACNIKRVGGLMSEFTCNANANVFYGFSQFTYALKFPVKNVFFFTNSFIQRMNRNSNGYQRRTSSGLTINNINSAKHMRFFDIADYYPTPTWKLGDPKVNIPTEHYSNGSSKWAIPDGQPVDPPTIDYVGVKFNIDDTANRPDIFTHRLLFFIDGQLFNNLIVYVESDYIIMVIDPDKQLISRGKIQELTNPNNDYRWTIIGVPFGNYYSDKEYITGENVAPIIIDYPLDDGSADAGFSLGSSVKITGNRYNPTTEDRQELAPSYTCNITSRWGQNQYFDTYAQYNDIDSVYLFNCSGDDRNIGLANMSINQLKRTVSTVTNTYEPDEEGYIKTTTTETRDFRVDCFSSNRPSYNLIGSNVATLLQNQARGLEVGLIELKNAASVINLGSNRIFKVGCDQNIPGPVPPENVVIFKRTAEDGLRLVHMVASKYKDSNMSEEQSDYDKEVLRVERPNEPSLAFKSVDKDSVYDYPKFIPIRDKYNAEAQKYVDLYYPNIFKLEGFNAADDLVALVFYDKTVVNAFTNPLEKYMEYDPTYANNIVSGNVPEAIRNYIPAINRYTEDAFLNGFHTKATRAIEYQFKLDSLRELVNDDGNRLVDIYDRKYNKDKNKMNTSIKYIIDMTRDAPETLDNYSIKHIYRNQLKVSYIYSININIHNVIVYDNGVETVHPIDSLTIYYDQNNNPMIHCSDSDINGDPFIPNDTRYVNVTISNNVAIVPYVNRTFATPKRIYTFTMHHKIPMQYPATVWVDGVRLSNQYYYVNSSSHTSTVSIYSSALVGASYVEIEVYKIKNNTAITKQLTLSDLHNSTSIKSSVNEQLWDELSPQNTIVAVATQVVDPVTSEYVTKYKVPSNYEAYWLLIGHIRYANGIPTNIPEDPRDAAHIYAYNIIKSLQTTIDTETGEETHDEVVIMTDEGEVSRAIIGETAETYAGNVDILKTFGDTEYYKVLEDVDYGARFTCKCGLTFGIVHDGETCQFCHTEVAKRPLNKYYVTMLREGFYNRDRKRFFEYLPMKKKDPLVYITPITDYFANKNVMVKNTDIYFSKVYTLPMLNGRVTKNSFTVTDFEFDPSVTKYRLYMDGLLLDNGIDFSPTVDPTNRDETYFMGDPFTIFILKEFDWNMQHTIIFEYLPYRYELIHRSVETDGVVVIQDEYLRPFDSRNFDVYMDGKLLRDDEIDIVTEKRIIIKPIAYHLGELDHNPVISVYEKMHDADVFDYVWRTHKTGFEYIDHDTPIIEVDDMTFYNKIQKVIVKGENDDPDDMSGTVFRFNGINVYKDADNNMALDMTTRDITGAMLDPDVEEENKFVVTDYYTPSGGQPNVTVFIIPYSRTVTTPRKTGKDNIKRQPLDPSETIDVRMAENIKHSLEEQLIRTDSNYRRERTPTFNTPSGV